MYLEYLLNLTKNSIPVVFNTKYKSISQYLHTKIFIYQIQLMERFEEIFQLFFNRKQEFSMLIFVNIKNYLRDSSLHFYSSELIQQDQNTLIMLIIHIKMFTSNSKQQNQNVQFKEIQSNGIMGHIKAMAIY
ncbi:unnamed protein product [Paramecium octaurelia]|uniref:Uncharacterized protein n=1 Tax=Paramecium octaurelia TaxID=43137 RepID=A0A8S1UM02_PAROT|nr:unnamed protein product [Paramecium octaurelia]